MQAPNKDSERIARVLGALRGKWTIQILCELRHGPVRLGQLKRSIPTASKKALTSSLRWLEDAQLIVRRDLTKSILHVEYELDDRTKEPLAALLTFLADWASLLPDDAVEYVRKNDSYRRRDAFASLPLVGARRKT
ncbi:MAG TPA: helix-turn-helix domain-containing protein [Terracidiphilus sp.]